MRTLKIFYFVTSFLLLLHLSFAFPISNPENQYKSGIFLNQSNRSVFIDTINIPADQPTIQAGIESAQSGDLVLVAEGTYVENIVFRGRNITLASHFILDGDESHIHNTIIDGSQPLNQNEGSAIIFRNYEDTTTVVCGFTITGGTGSYQGFMSGGGILIYLATPIIENNIIENNIIDSPIGETGGGICAYIQSGFPLIIRNNIIRDNILKNTSTHTYGGGIAIWSDDYSPYLVRVTIGNNLIENNESLGNTFSYGGGILVYGNGPAWWASIKNNKIIRNSVSLSSSNGYGGGLALNYTNSIVANNLIVYNKAYESAGIKNIDEGLWSNTYVNNTICYNQAIFDEGGISTNYLGQMINCIVWENQPNEFSSGSQVLEITYSLVGENYSGLGNITGNPSFIDTVNFLLDESLSPCIDAGNPDPSYYDIEDLNNLGYALYPALGTIINDMGHFGGPNSNWIITDVKNEIIDNMLPEIFNLSQNYPNPFNPVTKIKFEIPGQARNDNTLVTLKVYDILGREVATLVNEEKPAGEYEVEFNGSESTKRDLFLSVKGWTIFRNEENDFVEISEL